MYDGKLFHHTIRCPFSTVTLSLLFPMHPSIASSSSHALNHGFSVSPLDYASIFLPESPQKLHRYPLWNTPDIFLRKSLHASQAADSRKVYSDHTLYPGVLPASRFQMHSLPAYEVLPEPSLQRTTAVGCSHLILFRMSKSRPQRCIPAFLYTDDHLVI